MKDSTKHAIEKTTLLMLGTIIPLMNNDIREQVHAELAPCTAQEFMTKYFELAGYDAAIDALTYLVEREEC